MDRFDITLHPPLAKCPPERRPYRKARIAINGQPLVELVRIAEEPWARAEYTQQLPEFENPDEFRFEPGAYDDLPASLVLLPCRQLLDRPLETGFVLEPDDPCRGKATVLGCTCGEIECWFIQVRIKVLPNAITWSEFGQFHRPQWRYELGPFTFDRSQYESQLAQER